MWFPKPKRERCKRLTDRQLLEKIMAGIEDLKAAVTAIVAAIGNLNTLVEQVIAKLQAGGLSDADAEALAVQLQGGITAINDETAKLNQD